MPLDPIRVADTRSWIEKAQVDFRGADADLAASPPVVEDVFFHAQQAVEKMLKAFLTWHDCPFRKTHALEETGELCLSIDPTLKELVDRAVPLTEYASKFRYPGVMEPPVLEDARAALAVAREVFAAITARLPAETLPTQQQVLSDRNGGSANSGLARPSAPILRPEKGAQDRRIGQ